MSRRRRLATCDSRSALVPALPGAARCVLSGESSSPPSDTDDHALTSRSVMGSRRTPQLSRRPAAWGFNSVAARRSPGSRAARCSGRHWNNRCRGRAQPRMPTRQRPAPPAGPAIGRPRRLRWSTGPTAISGRLRQPTARTAGSTSQYRVTAGCVKSSAAESLNGAVRIELGELASNATVQIEAVVFKAGSSRRPAWRHYQSPIHGRPRSSRDSRPPRAGDKMTFSDIDRYPPGHRPRACSAST